MSTTKAALLASRATYYLASVATLLLGIRNRAQTIGAFLPRSARAPFVIALQHSPLRFKVRGALDIWVIKETCLDRDYEPDGVNIENGWTIVDIGAGIGDFAIHAASGRDRSVVYAYEPFPASYELLLENLELNSISNIRAFQLAVGREEGSTELFVGSTEAVQHSTAQAESRTTPAAITVPITTLDSIFDELALGHCDFLKIDCEGAEFDILFHASDSTLRRIRHMSLEYHDSATQFTHRDLAAFLGDHGFQVQLRPNRVHADLGLMYARNTRAP